MDIVKVNEEKDLGVLIDCNLKFHSQCSTVVNKANRLLGLIKQTFSDISVDSFTCLYKSIVRPILEYGNLVWGPYYKTDIQKLEKIQWKGTRMIKSIRNLDYEERLKVLNLPSLYYRRYRGDMIAVYNMLHDKYDLIKNSQAVKKGAAPIKAMVKKDVKSKVAAKKWL